jgi:hypothetical protein
MDKPMVFPAIERGGEARAAVVASASVMPGRIRLPKIGWLRVRGMALADGADMKQAAVTQEPTGWHVSIQCEAVLNRTPSRRGPLLPLHLATLNDGMRIEHPRLAARRRNDCGD